MEAQRDPKQSKTITKKEQNQRMHIPDFRTQYKTCGADIDIHIKEIELIPKNKPLGMVC